jgi:uncharacterized protein
MKKDIIVDSGPLIALFNKSDRYHERILKFLKNFNGRLKTSWIVVSEVMHLLSFSVNAQLNFLEWIARGGLIVEDIKSNDMDYLIKRIKKYSDLPMDLADASLMCLAERENILQILSIDSDFDIYKTLKGKSLQNVLG